MGAVRVSERIQELIVTVKVVTNKRTFEESISPDGEESYQDFEERFKELLDRATDL